jgi:hypothetical protein
MHGFSTHYEGGRVADRFFGLRSAILSIRNVQKSYSPRAKEFTKPFEFGITNALSELFVNELCRTIASWC